MPVQSQSLNEFIAVSPPDASLLGAPLFPEALKDAALNKKLEEFKRLSSNIKLINAHDALLILKASSSTSHVLFMLRCSPCLSNAILSQIDEVLKSNISHIANVVLSDVQWIQASLPVKAGGLGIRRAASLALPAYLASTTSIASLQDLILIRSIIKRQLTNTTPCTVQTGRQLITNNFHWMLQHENNVLGMSL